MPSSPMLAEIETAYRAAVDVIKTLCALQRWGEGVTGAASLRDVLAGAKPQPFEQDTFRGLRKTLSQEVPALAAAHSAVMCELTETAKDNNAGGNQGRVFACGSWGVNGHDTTCRIGTDLLNALSVIGFTPRAGAALPAVFAHRVKAVQDVLSRLDRGELAKLEAIVRQECTRTLTRLANTATTSTQTIPDTPFPVGREPLQPDSDFHRKCMERAVEEARKSAAEDDRVHPKVGVVVVKGGKILATAHRGEMAKGEHAEFTALEKKLLDAVVAGATVYTTLEPCTTRNHPKLPCADRLIERKVKRVVIGMLDPNPDICGKGYQKLRSANVAVDLFDDDLKSQIEEMNREFARHYHDSLPKQQHESAATGAKEPAS